VNVNIAGTTDTVSQFLLIAGESSSRQVVRDKYQEIVRKRRRELKTKEERKSSKN
jgi:hypothetical protein